ncbi:MAG: transglycosylase domain-containing protein, partial [Henriciella sp.]
MLDTLKDYLYSWRFVRHAAIAAVAFATILLLSIWMWVITLSRGLPSELALAEYEPPITSRVHAGDGTLIYEFADQHRVFIPYDAIPEHVVQAFIAAEDKNFFSHNGLDYAGILRGARNSLISKLFGSGALQGGSTITQQVAKNMLLSNAQAVERKIKEAIVARRMEQTFSKEHILELYLNEIYLGGRSYGVGSAALNYFNKSLPELN